MVPGNTKRALSLQTKVVMIVIVPLIQYAAAMAAATVVFSSGRNMIQTWRIVKSINSSNGNNIAAAAAVQNEQGGGGGESDAVSILGKVEERFTRALKCTEGEPSTNNNTTLEQLLDEIRSLKRKDFLELYFSSTLCRSPKTISEIQGEWDGILTNNGPILVCTVFNITIFFLFNNTINSTRSLRSHK